MNRSHSADDEELQGVLSAEPVPEDILELENVTGAVLPVMEKEALACLLTREQQVAQDGKRGQGRRDAQHCMREALDAYCNPDHSRTDTAHLSIFGAF